MFEGPPLGLCGGMRGLEVYLRPLQGLGGPLLGFLGAFPGDQEAVSGKSRGRKFLEIHLEIYLMSVRMNL